MDSTAKQAKAASEPRRRAIPGPPAPPALPLPSPTTTPASSTLSPSTNAPQGFPSAMNKANEVAGGPRKDVEAKKPTPSTTTDVTQNTAASSSASSSTSAAAAVAVGTTEQPFRDDDPDLAEWVAWNGGRLVQGQKICSICLDPFDAVSNPAMLYICGHAFHLQCAETWRAKNNCCPLCWRELLEVGIYAGFSAASSEDGDAETDPMNVRKASSGSNEGSGARRVPGQSYTGAVSPHQGVVDGVPVGTAAPITHNDDVVKPSLDNSTDSSTEGEYHALMRRDRSEIGRMEVGAVVEGVSLARIEGAESMAALVSGEQNPNQPSTQQDQPLSQQQPRRNTRRFLLWRILCPCCC